MSAKQLSGRVAVVTGASKGIGAAIARHLGDEGASVVVNYSSSKEAADKVVAGIVESGGKAIAVRADVSKPDQIPGLFAEATKAFGPVDILVNNAGIYRAGPLGEITVESYREQFDLNVLGLILATQEAVKAFNPEGGSIINISSIVNSFAPAGSAVYNATKGAVDALTRTFAKELGPKQIRVNSLNPGMVETEGLHSSGFIAGRDGYSTLTPLGRIGQPDDIAPMAVFLASPGSSWITGETFYVGGGVR